MYFGKADREARIAIVPAATFDPFKYFPLRIEKLGSQVADDQPYGNRTDRTNKYCRYSRQGSKHSSDVGDLGRICESHPRMLRKQSARPD